MSAEYADVLLKAGKPEQIDQVPIGTGPFSFVAYQRDATIRYRRFDEFWGPKAKLDGAGVLHQQGPGGAPGQAARQWSAR